MILGVLPVISPFVIRVRNSDLTKKMFWPGNEDSLRANSVRQLGFSGAIATAVLCLIVQIVRQQTCQYAKNRTNNSANTDVTSKAILILEVIAPSVESQKWYQWNEKRHAPDERHYSSVKKSPGITRSIRAKTD